MNGSQSLVDGFSLFSCSSKSLTQVTKPRSEICIHFLSSERMDNRESYHALFSSFIMAKIWLVLELLICMNKFRRILNIVRCEGFSLFNAFRSVQHMGGKSNYFTSTLKLFKYPRKILFYSAIVCLKTVIVAYFIAMIATEMKSYL